MKAILGLGSNQRQADCKIRQAVALLAQCDCQILAQTDVYHVSGNYLNAVAAIETSLDYDSLNCLCKELERRLGRTPASRAAGEVPIDIDVVIYDARVMRPNDFSQDYFKIGYQQILTL